MTQDATPDDDQRARPSRGQGRAEILSAAAAEFSAKGYAGATTAAIARLAGVTQPLVHHHFGSKRKLWSEALGEMFAALDGVLGGAIAAYYQTPSAETFRDVIRQFALFSGRNPFLTRVIAVESAAASPHFDYLYTNHLETTLHHVEAWLQHAVAQGILAADVDTRMLRNIIVGACTHIFRVSEEVRRFDGIDPMGEEIVRAHAELAVRIVTTGMLGEGAAS